MTLQSFLNPVLVGAQAFRDATATTYTLDANGEYVAWIIQAPKTGTLDRIHFGATTVTADGDGLRCRIETVSATDGNPSGTLVGGSSEVTIVTTTPNSWNRGTAGLNAAVTKGDIIAVKLTSPAAGTTFNGIIRANFGSYNGPHTGSSPLFPYIINAIPTATKATAGGMAFGLEYTDGSMAPILMAVPATSVTVTAFNSTTSPDERGNLFQVPFPVRLAGVYHQVYAGGANQSFDIVLYNAAGTILESISVDMDQLRSASPSNSVVYFDTPVTLTANTDYRLTILPTVTSNINTTQFAIDTAVGGTRLRDATIGANWKLTTRTDAGAWTDTADTIACIGLIVDQFDDGAGGGSSGGKRVGYGGGAIA